MPNVITDMSDAARTLISWFRKEASGSPPERIYTWAEMSREAGRDVQRNRSAYETCKRVLQREDLTVLLAVRGVGCKIANDHEKVALQHSTLKHISRTSRKGRKIGRTVESANLVPRDQLTFVSISTILGLAETLSREKSIRTIEQHATGKAKALEARSAIELLKEQF